MADSPDAPQDEDGDGYTLDDGDCDDNAPRIHPNARERCNGIDDDCTGVVDDGAEGPRVFYADADGDGFGDPNTQEGGCEAPEGYRNNAGDCDDTSPAINPLAADDDCQQEDLDCDGLSLENNVACD